MPMLTPARSRIVVVLAAAIALLLLGATAVVATHDFTDVPNSAFYHDAVHFLKDHGITGGCAPAKYCPERGVTRGETALFLQRTANLAPRLARTYDDEAFSTTSSTFTDITGALVGIEVPNPNNSTLLITFSGETVCSGGGADAEYCAVRIMVDGTQAFPNVGSNFAFDSDDNGSEGANSWEGRSMQRVIYVGPGFHSVSVQAARIGDSATFTIDDWILTVQSFVDLT